MKLRRWQQKVIDEFPEITKNYKKFILKAPTGAGKTVLASEIINRFYKNIKIKKELNDDEALFSNQKIKDVLGFKEQHNWKKYL